MKAEQIEITVKCPRCQQFGTNALGVGSLKISGFMLRCSECGETIELSPKALDIEVTRLKGREGL